MCPTGCKEGALPVPVCLAVFFIAKPASVGCLRVTFGQSVPWVSTSTRVFLFQRNPSETSLSRHCKNKPFGFLKFQQQIAKRCIVVRAMFTAYSKSILLRFHQDSGRLLDRLNAFLVVVGSPRLHSGFWLTGHKWQGLCGTDAYSRVYTVLRSIQDVPVLDGGAHQFQAFAL